MAQVTAQIVKRRLIDKGHWGNERNDRVERATSGGGWAFPQGGFSMDGRAKTSFVTDNLVDLGKHPLD